MFIIENNKNGMNELKNLVNGDSIKHLQNFEFEITKGNDRVLVLTRPKDEDADLLKVYKFLI